MNRRQFIGAIGLPVGAAACGLGALRPLTSEARALLSTNQALPGNAGVLARDEKLWFDMARAFTPDRSIINLNNGGVSPAPTIVQDAVKRHLDHSNTAPSYVMWRQLAPRRETVRVRFAQVFGCDPESVAFTRNASESLQICQFGIDLAPGDHVLTTNQDYPRMINAFKQREKREGLTLDLMSIPTPSEDAADIVRIFEAHITSRTKLILVSHVINLTGQIMPVKAICAVGRKHGIPVIVDGAHAIAHLDFKIDDLDCDYYAASLHKWLFAPHGTGLLYVRRSRIAGLWPLMAARDDQVDDIRKFEEIGTHPIAPYLAIGEALTFHEGIGAARKLARMLYLRDYWAQRLLKNDRTRLHTSLEPGCAGGFACVSFDGLDDEKLSAWLWQEHRILTTFIKHDEFGGMRISPSVYTTLSELDRFCDAVEHALEHGLPES